MAKSSKSEFVVHRAGEELARTKDEAEANQLAAGLNGAEVKPVDPAEGDE